MLLVAKHIQMVLLILLVVITASCVGRIRGFFGHTVLTKPGSGRSTTPRRSHASRPRPVRRRRRR
jgi:hypothetical protein